MLKLAKKYMDYFDLDEASGLFRKLFNGFMITLPHIIPSLILIILFPSSWIGIIVFGLVLPDVYFFVYKMYTMLFPRKKEYAFGLINLSMKTIAHIVVFAILIVLLVNREYILALAGALHLIIDLLGF